MKNALIFVTGLTLTLSASVNGAEIASFDPSLLHLNGSYCTFERKPHEIILAGDWAGKYWMKVDGKMIELVSHTADAEAERHLASKRWHETLRGADVEVELRLVELGRGEDSAAYKGYLTISRRGASTRMSVKGGCGA